VKLTKVFSNASSPTMATFYNTLTWPSCHSIQSPWKNTQ